MPLPKDTPALRRRRHAGVRRGDMGWAVGHYMPYVCAGCVCVFHDVSVCDYGVVRERVSKSLDVGAVTLERMFGGLGAPTPGRVIRGPGVVVTVVCGVRGAVRQSTVSHEAGHTARQVLEWAGVAADFDNDEAEAYLEGWVANQIHLTCRWNGLRVVPEPGIGW